MLSPSMIDELTREYLHLTFRQNNVLTKSVQLERMFQKFKNDKNFTNIFTYVEKLTKVSKHFHISDRPVILAMGELTRFMNEVRSSSKDLGFLYPEQGLLVQLLGPRKVRDQLTYRQLPSLPLALPSISDLLKDTVVSPEDRETIAANLSSA